MRTRGSRVEPTREILRFVGHQSFDAHRVRWYISTNSVTKRSRLPIVRRTVKPFLFGWTRECSAGRGSARPRGRFHVRPQNRSRPKHPNGAPAPPARFDHPSQSPHTLPAIIFGPLNSLCCTLFLRMALLHVPSAYPNRSGFCGAVHGKRPPTKD